MSEQAVESCELGLSVCSAAHAAEVGDCEVTVTFNDMCVFLTCFTSCLSQKAVMVTYADTSTSYIMWSTNFVLMLSVYINTGLPKVIEI